MMTPDRIVGPTSPGSTAPGITLEPMTRDHLAAVLAIEAHALHRPWSLATFVRELAQENERTYLVARDGDAVVGFGGIMYVLDEGHITTISVTPERHGERIGTRLMVALLRAAIDKGMVSSSLEVRTGNDPAISMYRRFGYTPAGIRPNYYAEVGEDAVVMWAHDINTVAYSRRLQHIQDSLEEPNP